MLNTPMAQAVPTGAHPQPNKGENDAQPPVVAYDHLWLNATEAGAALDIGERAAQARQLKHRWPTWGQPDGRILLAVPMAQVVNPRYKHAPNEGENDAQAIGIDGDTMAKQIETVCAELRKAYDYRSQGDRDQIALLRSQCETKDGQITMLQNENLAKTTALVKRVETPHPAPPNRPWWRWW